MSTVQGDLMTAAEYRQYAAECLEALKITTSPEERVALLLMAERWEKLAAYLERASSTKSDT